MFSSRRPDLCANAHHRALQPYVLSRKSFLLCWRLKSNAHREIPLPIAASGVGRRSHSEADFQAPPGMGTFHQAMPERQGRLEVGVFLCSRRDRHRHLTYCEAGVPDWGLIPSCSPMGEHLLCTQGGWEFESPGEIEPFIRSDVPDSLSNHPTYLIVSKSAVH